MVSHVGHCMLASDGIQPSCCMGACRLRRCIPGVNGTMQVPESAELLALQPLCYARARYQPFMKPCVVTGQGEEARAPLAASLHPPLVACIAWPLARRSGSGEVAELGQINAHVIFLHGCFFSFQFCFLFCISLGGRTPVLFW